jgi:hypothetical protein
MMIFKKSNLNYIIAARVAVCVIAAKSAKPPIGATTKRTVMLRRKERGLGAASEAGL